MFEYEKKIMLTEGEYNAILTVFGSGVDTIFQTNYYFDTEDLSMDAHDVTCRIRGKDGKYKTTIKHHNSGEVERSVEEYICESFTFDPSPFKVLGLQYQGELSTERKMLCRCKQYQVMLDKNTFLGCVDYELEVEYLPGYSRKALNYICNIGMTLAETGLLNHADDLMKRIGQGQTKSKRFFEKLKNTKKKV